MTRTTKLIIGIIIAVIIVGGIWYGATRKPAEKGTIKIGIVMPFSGELSMFGDNVLHGVEVALRQSGLAISTIKIIAEDTAGFSTNGALSAFRKLVDQDRVDVVFGPFGPAQTLTIAPTIATGTALTIISLSNCDERFATYPGLFCIYPGIKDQVLHEIGFMKSKGWKKIYFFTENSEFGILVENMLKERPDEITLLGVEKVVPNQTKDFRTNIAKMVAAKPDAVFAVFAPNEGFVLLRQYQVLSKGIPLYIGTDANKDQLKDIFGQEAKGIYFASRISEKYEDNFVKEYKASFGVDPDYFAALAHSAATILFDALKNDGRDMVGLPKKLIGLTSDATAVSGFRFKEDRTVYVPLGSYEFKNGDFVKVE